MVLFLFVGTLSLCPGNDITNKRSTPVGTGLVCGVTCDLCVITCFVGDRDGTILDVR